MLARIIAVIVVACGVAHAQELTEQTYRHYRDFILPDKGELGFEQIAWRATFWDAVVEAQARDKPILVWAMNGHPLACT